jgi:hypothetical protein
MFEAQIEQGLDMIRRFKTNLGISLEQIEKLPEESNVRITEETAWLNSIRYGIEQVFGRESQELNTFSEILRKSSEERIELGKNYISRYGHTNHPEIVWGPTRSLIERNYAIINLLRELDAKYKIRKEIVNQTHNTTIGNVNSSSKFDKINIGVTFLASIVTIAAFLIDQPVAGIIGAIIAVIALVILFFSRRS